MTDAEAIKTDAENTETAASDAQPAESLLAFELRVSRDNMVVQLDCELTAENIGPLSIAIREQLFKSNYYHPPNTQTIQELLRARFAEQPRLERYPILEGIPVIPAVDAVIEWGADYFSQGFVVDPETGAMDYRQRIARTTVAQGELLATLVPGVEGKEGRDVTGKTVKPGKVKVPRIKPGANVRHNTDTDEFFAELDGRIRWMNGVLTVDDIYTVSGSVGLQTGNISHPGALIIEKDVLVDSRIITGGDIEVHGMVDPCIIETGGDLTVHGGITGGPGHHIKVEGVLHAKFILNAHVEAAGGIVVEKEILHSDMHARGPIDVKNGRILGGAVSALGGITVGEAGSEAGVPTALTTGLDPIYEAELEKKIHEMTDLETRTQKIHGAIDTLLPHFDRLPAEKQASLQKLVDGVHEMEQRITVLHEEVEELKEDFNAKACHEIHIRKIMHPECLLTVRNHPMKMTATIEGPITAFSVHGELKLRGS
ncbi:MAG: DUF342 domain-containing protein [Candidatus Hydrogenedentes bacterium]|nr:DUF342 domain-containing protein [Candidatus Hydrogenedentota bacterium]